ncbi:tRNA lysidine(34) synthetase TilS [Thermovibrio sp.]
MLKSKVSSTISKFQLIPPGSKVVVALSGGPDSVALLLVLLELQKELNIKVGAVHVNHLLRGKESFRDEEFVRRLTDRLKVPLIVKRVNVKEVSKGRNVEAVARELRYKALREALKELKGDLIALGHTSSDLLETVLLNLTKGSGIKGLRGFLPKREVFIRPLFEVSRKEVEEYLKEKGAEFITDSSNFSLDFERNLIRLKVVPVLREINPKVEEAVLRSSLTLREVESFIASQIEPLLSKFLKGERAVIPLKEFFSLHPLLRKELLIEISRKLSGKGLSKEKVNSILKLCEKEGFGEIHIREGLYAYKEQERLVIAKGKREEPCDFYYTVKELPSEIKTEVGKLKFSINRGTPIASLSELNGKAIIVRSRKPKDRLKFKGFSKSLKKFFIEKKVPATLRRKIPVVEVSGEIVLIPKLYKREVRPEEPFVGVEFEAKDAN